VLNKFVLSCLDSIGVLMFVFVCCFGHLSSQIEANPGELLSYHGSQTSILRSPSAGPQWQATETTVGFPHPSYLPPPPPGCLWQRTAYRRVRPGRHGRGHRAQLYVQPAPRRRPPLCQDCPALHGRSSETSGACNSADQPMGSDLGAACLRHLLVLWLARNADV
jgi:hypothetical protein